MGIEKTKLVFRNIKIQDKEIFDHLIKNSNTMSCQLSFPNLYCLALKYDTKICIDKVDNFLFIQQSKRDEGDYASYMVPIDLSLLNLSPISEDKSRLWMGIYKLKSEVNLNNKKLMLFGVTEDLCQVLKEEGKFDFTYEEKRDWADYIYLTKKLIALDGKKLANKRNELNIFMRQYGTRLIIKKISKDKIQEIKKFQEKWFCKNVKNNLNQQMLIYENKSIQYALNWYEELGLEGIIMYIDGVVAGYSYGYPMTNQLMDVIVEKADYSYENIYRAINQQFVMNCCMDYQYINREEDIGLTGLRQVKLSYQPQILLKKYNLYEV